jgi:metallo-beta-lactamase family protein
MVEGGRIQEHVMNHIERPNDCILIAGFCAEGTLGYRLLLGQPSIKIKDKDKKVQARIAKIDVFSSHPDHDEILEFIYACHPTALKNVFLIHGELPQLEAIKKAVLQLGVQGVEIPKQGQFFEFN